MIRIVPAHAPAPRPGPMPMPERSATLKGRTGPNARYALHELAVDGAPLLIDIPADGDPERAKHERRFRTAVTSYCRRKGVRIAVRILPDNRAKLGAWRVK